LIGLVLALLSAAAINIGFLLQHRGLGERLPEPDGPWKLMASRWARAPTVVVHLFAVAVVLGCVPVLARAQVEIAGETGELAAARERHALYPAFEGLPDRIQQG
jgi:hypothetical protein